MKRILSLMACVTVLLSLSVPAFATEVADVVPTPEIVSEEVTEPVTVEAETDDKQIVVNVAVNNAAPAESVEDELTNGKTLPDEVSQIAEEESAFYMAYSVRSLDESGTDAPSDSIPAMLIALFGEYTPRTQTVTQYFADGSEIIYQEVVPGLAGLDWLWLVSVALFGMGLYCVFRVIGGCIKWI